MTNTGNASPTISYVKAPKRPRHSLVAGETMVLTGPRAGTIERAKINYTKRSV